jgi:hypothetical protein
MITTRGMTIRRPLRGPRRVMVERNGRTIVAYGRRGGYVERPYMMRGGRRYFQRTYVVNGRTRVVVYRSYAYRGVVYYRYAPVYYYHPVYYRWAYNPWPAPVYYAPAAWGWAGSPWYGYYGPYFAPYPVYPAASLWLTDYIIAANLQAAYAAQAEANAAAAQASASSQAAPATYAANVPPTLSVCEQGGCSTWTWDGAHYNAAWSNGSVSVLSVVRWDAGAVVLTRTDPAGTSAGNYATYSGRIITPNTVGGSVAGVYNGRPWSETWNGTSPTPVLVASVAAPPTSDPPPAPAGSQASTGQVQLSPQVKQMVADEVKAQLASEQSSANDPSQSGGGDVPEALNPAVRVFVVSSSFDVANGSGEECALTAGDVVMRITDTPDATQAVSARVLSSMQADCTAGQTVAIGVQDLQEMYNQLQQQVDSGLKQLADNSGKGGLPKAPDTSTTAGEVPAPAADPSAAAQVADAQQQADQTEAAVQQ